MRKSILLLLALSGCAATPAYATNFPDRGRLEVHYLIQKAYNGNSDPHEESL